jgi:hypothetical protein
VPAPAPDYGRPPEPSAPSDYGRAPEPLPPTEVGRAPELESYTGGWNSR